MREAGNQSDPSRVMINTARFFKHCKKISVEEAEDDIVSNFKFIDELRRR